MVLAEKLGTDENEDMILQSVPLSICMLFEQNLLLENVQKACGFGPQLTKLGNPSTIGGDFRKRYSRVCFGESGEIEY